jgi:hypothetical protein
LSEGEELGKQVISSDRLWYSRLPGDKASAKPTHVEVNAIQCVDPHSFIEADPVLENLDAEATVPLEVATARLESGYALFINLQSISQVAAPHFQASCP